jgi:hypothetical protein
LSLFEIDDRGVPILLADHESELPEIVTPDATSGRAEWGRYSDAVREASRTYDDPGESEITQFLHARARNPQHVDVPAFREAVHRQRMSDLVDISDHHLRTSGSLPRGARHIRTQAPKNYVRKALKNSSSEDLAHLRHRLISIGHDPDNVDSFIGDRAGTDKSEAAKVIEINLADGEFEGLIFDATNFPGPDWEDQFEDVREMIRTIYETAPPPIVNVYVNSKET